MNALGVSRCVMVYYAMKTCTRCGADKPETSFQFTGHPGTRARRSICRACYKRDSRQRAGATPREEIARRTAEKEAKALAERDARRRQREAIAAHPLTVLRRLLIAHFEARCATEGRAPSAVEYKARWDRDPEFREAERRRQQRFKHARPDVAARYGDRRKLRAATLSDGTLTPDVLRRLFASANLCPYCAREMGERDRVLDHREPLSLGGAHSLSNVLVCCRECNREKRDRPWAEWVARIACRTGADRASCRKSLADNDLGSFDPHSHAGSATARASAIHGRSPVTLSLSAGF